MAVSRILAEYRYGKRVVLLERVENGEGHAYRTSIYYTFPAIEKAKQIFMKNIPQTKRKQAYYAKEIKSNMKEFTNEH